MRHRKRKTAKILRKHAERRAKQRFGMKLSDQDFKSMRSQIINNRAEFVRRESTWRTSWIVVVQGLTVRVVYDTKRKQIVTLLQLRN